MVWWTLSLLCIYVLVVFITQFLESCLKSHYWQGSAHYLLLLHNSQHKIEWVIRALQRSSSLEGKDFGLSYVDYGSTDHTLDIICRLSRGLQPHEGSNEDVIIIDLRNEQKGQGNAVEKGIEM